MTDSFEIERKRMIETQLARRGIRNAAVLNAMGKVPRHLFVPEATRADSYTDHPLSIGEEQTISQPYIVALMSQALELSTGMKVLDVGTGSGYQAAVLAELGARVFSIERIPSLAAGAAELLKRLGYTQVRVRVGDGALGWPEEAPFDGIIVTAAAPAIPQPLVDQLKVGGRLVLPVGSALGQKLLLVKRHGDSHEMQELCECVFVPLVVKGNCSF